MPHCFTHQCTYRGERCPICEAAKDRQRLIDNSLKLQLEIGRLHDVNEALKAERDLLQDEHDNMKAEVRKMIVALGRAQRWAATWKASAKMHRCFGTHFQQEAQRWQGRTLKAEAERNAAHRQYGGVKSALTKAMAELTEARAGAERLREHDAEMQRALLRERERARGMVDAAYEGGRIGVAASWQPVVDALNRLESDFTSVRGDYTEALENLLDLWARVP